MSETQYVQKEKAPDAEMVLTKTVDVEVDEMEEAEVYVKNETPKTNVEKDSQHEIQGPAMPFLSYLYVVVGKLSKEGVLVRKHFAVPTDPRLLRLNLNVFESIMMTKPYKYGLKAKNPAAMFSIAEHALYGHIEKTQYLSASNKMPLGAPGFDGQRVYIDIAKLKAAGGVVITPQEIINDLKEYKTQSPQSSGTLDELIETIEKVESETLIKAPPDSGGVPSDVSVKPNAVDILIDTIEKSEGETLIKAPPDGVVPPDVLVKPSAVGAHYAGRVLLVLSIVITAYDVGKAMDKSAKQDSIKPISAELIRQAGGWGGTVAGMAVGAKLFGAGGAAAGSIVPGAGTLVGVGVGGVIGSIVGGFAGYLGADWIADNIDEN